MPCTGPQTQGDFKFCQDSGAGFGFKPKCEWARKFKKSPGQKTHDVK